MLELDRDGIESMSLDELRPVVSAADIASARAEVDDTVLSDELASYTVAVVRRTRELSSVILGASPRAAVHLTVVAKAAARLAGRDFVIPDDVIRFAPAVLSHRLVLSPEASLERYGPADAISAALSAVPVPR